MRNNSHFLSLIFIASLSFGTQSYALDMHTPNTPDANNAAQTGNIPVISDADIITKVHNQLAADNTVSQLNLVVTCTQGIVTIKGTVPDQAHLDQVLKLANSVAGIKGIQSQMVIAK